MTFMVRLAVVCVLLINGCARADPRPNGIAPCCVSSASAKPTVGAGSPDDAWKNVLAAMQAGDDAALARFATPAGIASLESGAHGEDKHVAFKRWGKGWGEWEVRWHKRDAERAEAWLGPEAKEHGLVFVRTTDGWKLDRWTPGE
jgi:hypothetical protein